MTSLWHRQGYFFRLDKVEWPFIYKKIISNKDMIWTDGNKQYSKQTRKYSRIAFVLFLVIKSHPGFMCISSVSSLVSWCLFPFGFIFINVLNCPMRYPVMNLFVKTYLQIHLTFSWNVKIMSMIVFSIVLMITKYRYITYSIMHLKNLIWNKEYNYYYFLSSCYMWSSLQ